MEEISLRSYFTLSLSFGFLSLLTPCVFPLIPLTVSFFSKNSDKKLASILFEAFIFMFGVILTFSLLGVLISILFGASGLNKLSTNPYMNLTLFFIFTAFALNLFGVFEIYVSSDILNSINSKKTSNQILQNLLIAFLFTLTTFTCTMPFLGTLLVSAAKGEWFYPFFGMLGFSFSFSLPFAILAVFPKLLSRLPKSGSWLNSFKVCLGFLELGAGLKFLSNADMIWKFNFLSREIFLTVWTSIFFALSLYLFGFYYFSHEKKAEKGKSLTRILFAILSLSFTLYFYSGISGKNLGEWEAFFPPPSSALNSSSSKEIKDDLVWLSSLEEAKLVSAQKNLPIFIEFTGYTCTNCRWMEQNMFTVLDVKESLTKFILVKLYTDGEEAVHEKNQKYEEDKFGTIALPLYAIVDKNEKIISQFMGMTRDREEFKKFLSTPIPK